jgi:hypothetical protein
MSLERAPETIANDSVELATFSSHLKSRVLHLGYATFASDRLKFLLEFGFK